MNLIINSQLIFGFSDTHGKHRELQVPENVDIVICAGNAVEDNLAGNEYDDFIEWFASLPRKWKVFVSGNHELSFELDKAKEITDVQSKKDCVLNSHLIQVLSGIWIFLLNVVHSGIWNQYTAKISVHFQYTFEGEKNKNPSRSVSRGVE